MWEAAKQFVDWPLPSGMYKNTESKTSTRQYAMQPCNVFYENLSGSAPIQFSLYYIQLA